jgi:hypothetical protein
MSPSADHPRERYPVDIHGFVRQCAWCRRVADDDGRYRLIATTLLSGASHGCCEACAIRFVSRGLKPGRTGSSR